MFFKDEDFTDFFKGHNFLRIFSGMEFKKKTLHSTLIFKRLGILKILSRFLFTFFKGAKFSRFFQRTQFLSIFQGFL